MRRFVVLPLLAALSAVCLSLVGCSEAPDPWKEAKAGQKRVVASFPPLYSLPPAGAGDAAYVPCLLTGPGPHAYKVSGSDPHKLRGADLCVINGLGLDDDFMKRLINAGNRSVPVLNVG